MTDAWFFDGYATQDELEADMEEEMVAMMGHLPYTLTITPKEKLTIEAVQAAKDAALHPNATEHDFMRYIGQSDADMIEVGVRAAMKFVLDKVTLNDTGN